MGQECILGLGEYKRSAVAWKRIESSETGREKGKSLQNESDPEGRTAIVNGCASRMWVRKRQMGRHPTQPISIGFLPKPHLHRNIRDLATIYKCAVLEMRVEMVTGIVCFNGICQSSGTHISHEVHYLSRRGLLGPEGGMNHLEH